MSFVPTDPIDPSTSLAKPSPFVVFTEHAIPATFDESLSYQQALFALNGYIKNTVVPVINENAKITEQQTKVIEELEDYVNHYFDNLDVQDEINNKLDEMAESGELADIISIYLNSTALLSFDTVSDMKGADNLREGSNIKTDGYSTYSDGKGDFYRVRTLTSGDTIDEVNIIALTNYPTLIAEKLTSNVNNIKGFDTVASMKLAENLYAGNYIRTYGKTALNDALGAFYKVREKEESETPDEENVVALADNTLVAEKMRDPFITIFVGDSYGAMNTNWVTYYCQYNDLTLGTDAYNLCVGNAGFHDINEGSNTYLHNLQVGTASIPKNMVKEIIVCGGYNDRTEQPSTLKPLISEFATYVKTNFKNATCYVGMIANDGALDATRGGAVNYREWLSTQVLAGYKACTEYGLKYLNGVEVVMHNYQFFANDNVHPNENGCKELAKAISIARTGNYEYTTANDYEGVALTTSTITKGDNIYSININIVGQITSNILSVKTNGSLTFVGTKEMSGGSISVTLGTYTSTSMSHFRYVNYLSPIPVKMMATLYQATERPIYDGFITFNADGTITLTIYNNFQAVRYITTLSFINRDYSISLLMQ